MKFDKDTIKRYLSPNAYKDLDVFLEQLPMRAGQGIIIAGVAAWLAAGCCVVYVTMQASNILHLRADILKAESLTPTVPVITKVPVPGTEVEDFTKKLSDLYPQINFVGQANRIEMRSADTAKYGAFREAVGHAFNGGRGWRLQVESLCVGRECKNNLGLFGAFSVNRLRVDKPAG
ncbi:MAG: hypothetical protein H6865_04530 [Rhodospirillales bacterium]|nr:hypothetical protein [Alphaproteobacteria bacterium]MCB9986884.1 hypothetical protein [Rhodospirillales bacterium]USO08338.1 MAG: hypothetical protein H6866_03760 [Rhodospirillales bacterium]